MRIAIAQRLTLAHGIRGGMEQQAHQLATGLRARGHHVLVMTTPHPLGISEGKEDNIAVRYVAPGSWRRYSGRWWAACYNELARQHAYQPFDIILSQSAGALGYVQQAANDLRLPIVTIIHGTLQGTLRTLWRNVGSARGVYRLGRHLTTLPRLVWLWRRSVPYVARWIAVSQPVADEWRLELGIPAERIVAIPNGIATERFRPSAEERAATRARWNVPPDAPLLLAVGRLEYEKGFHLAIKAMAKLRATFPDARLLIAGAGIQQRALEAQAAPFNGAVRLLGHISQEELPALLAAGDVFLMPTLRDEAFPMTIVEAMATGLPVVASNVGGVPAAIDDGRTGLLVPLGDVTALVRAASELLRDDARRATLGRAAREAAISQFSHERMVSSTEDVLIEAIRANTVSIPKPSPRLP